ncbi:MAG TPA: peptide ligase PGM1-related protein [Jatrophihabitans sp.]|nr:peptide ligase PGM1-related protein [Jatrophihabitans sp.]
MDASSADPTLLIANSRTVEMVGDLTALDPAERLAGGHSALRMLWFAGTGDAVVLPFRPSEAYLAYVTALTGTDPASLAILIPPHDRLGGELVTPDRTADTGFRERVRTVVAERGIDRVSAVFTDVSVTQLAEAVGLSVSGHAFHAQGGAALVNSKAGFRAIASGAGAPIAAGLCTGYRAEARDLIGRMFGAGHAVILKREFTGGGLGNEILSPVPGVRVAGAPQDVVLPDPAALDDYLGRRWDWLSAGGRNRVVVEQYLAGCDTVYAEYLVGEAGAEPIGFGELLMAPVAVGQVVHGPTVTPRVRADLLAAGRPLLAALHAIGYRGVLSTDCVLTPAGDVVITETNGRISGSTHLHVSIEARVLAPEHRGRRVLVERFGLPVPSFGAAAERLAATGLGFDRRTGTGVLLTSDLAPDGTVSYCLVAADLPATLAMRERLAGLFARPAGREQTGPVPTDLLKEG